MPLRLSDRTSNSKALSTICRLLFRCVSFLAFRTRSSSMSMLVLMRRLYTILKHFCASRCASVSKLAPRVEAAAMLGRRARAASRPIRMLVRFGQAVFKFGVNKSSRMSRFAPRPVIEPPRPTAEYVPPRVVLNRWAAAESSLKRLAEKMA